ncbi:hypothetical protein ABZ890_43295 [Streptomyces sp. NPDC046984]|uniref:hypothetical protein n=1 Tax=Streptomyces sp. NPDC046984 TaxID=3155138 RepID=UPI00340D6A35
MTRTKRLWKLMALTATATCAMAFLAGTSWLVAGLSGLLAAGVACAVVMLLVVRLLHVPPPAKPPRPSRLDVPFRDAPYARYRKLFSALSWGQLSARQFDYSTRPHLERVTADLLQARCGIDSHACPEAAREVLGARLWTLVSPERARSDDSQAPAVPLSDVARLIDRLETL